MQEDVRVERVDTKETRNGNTRYVLRDGQGREFTTSRPKIGEEAMRCAGRRARIEFHEEERNGFTNVYLDGITPLQDEAASGGGTDTDTDVEEAAWRTAIEAAPWLVGESDEGEKVDADQMFEKLKPFQERVADDIRDGDDDPEGEAER
jgi:hypothetical protein